ncbi:MAG: NAD(P)/FAD-dependent oxidoreductase [Chitinophagales bacterium]|nr:NAD(P)/FAD-dependent oxidoreductase [Chitinophagales bacterium]
MHIPSTKFDVVIIGSGLGGMVCGTILSKEGRTVCVIEKNEQIGGSLQTFRREGVTFDTGVHYIGGLAPGESLYKIFNYLGIMERLETMRMNEQGFDAVLFKDDSNEYLFGMGYDKFKAQLISKFPEDAAAIEKYCADMQRICAGIPLYNLQEGDPQDMEAFTIGAKAYFEQLTSNLKLQNVLAGTNLLYAGVADKTPLYVHALVVNSYIESAYKVKNGGDQIVKLMARIIKENGGEVLRKQEVKKIGVENGKAEYVELKSGERIYAETFISNLHPAKTLEITETDVIRPVFRNRIKELENSISTFVVYAILQPGSFKFRNRNYYYYDEVDVWKGVEYTEANWPYMYAMFEEVPEKQNEFTEAVTIMTYMRFDDVEKWRQTHHTTLDENERAEEYQQFKKEKAEKVLKTIDIKFPGFSDNVQSYYTSTPLSYRDYMGTDDGNMYGIMKDFNEPVKTLISAKTKVPNLLLTGQSINLHGVLGVTESALVTCSAILGKAYLLNKIKEANA